jgi:hypothetical protein
MIEELTRIGQVLLHAHHGTRTRTSVPDSIAIDVESACFRPQKALASALDLRILSSDYSSKNFVGTRHVDSTSSLDAVTNFTIVGM